MQYSEAFSDFIAKVNVNECSLLMDQANYMPHHAVLREDHESTKVLIDKDALFKSLNDISLNDSLETDPILQSDLLNIFFEKVLLH